VGWVLDGDTVIDARVRGGVQRRSVGLFKKDDMKVLRPITPLSFRQLDSMQMFAVAQIGRGYDWCGIAGFPLWGDGSGDRWFCSELVAAICATGGFQLVPRASGNFVTPEQIYQSSALAVLQHHQWSDTVL
jgi:hypothetical protein